MRHSRAVPRGSSRALLGAGFVVLVVLLVGLVQMTGSATESAPPPVRSVAAPAPAPVVEPVAAPAPRPAPVAAREPKPRAPAIRAAPVPELAPATDDAISDGVLVRTPEGKLVPIFSVIALRPHMNLVAGAMNNCIEKSGQRPTGKATLSFTIGPKDNRIVIESSAVLDEETLAGNPELLQCMHQTAQAFAPVLEGHAIPQYANPVYIRRDVRLDNGEIVEDSLRDFSYGR